MNMINLNETMVSPGFDSGDYTGTFTISNKYLNHFWFNCNELIWDKLSVEFAVIVEREIKTQMKSKMNEESYKDIFLNGGLSE